MPLTDLIYHYDGTFEGFLCCVFTCFTHHELPMDIYPPGCGQACLFKEKTIPTVQEQARRVYRSFDKKMGRDAKELIEMGFLTCLPQKELHLLRFIRLGYKLGPAVVNDLCHDTVSILTKAVKHLYNETHRYKQFIRFSEQSHMLTAVIEPKNHVLSLLQPHFCDRYTEETFLIYDKTYKQALIYRPYQHIILPVEEYEQPSPNQEETQWHDLWRQFYRTIAIEGRKNPKCQMSHMPKRYWAQMTEHQPPGPKELPMPQQPHLDSHPRSVPPKT